MKEKVLFYGTRKIIWALLLVFPLYGSMAQTANKDSLLAVLKNQKQDTNKVNTLFQIARNYEKNDLDSAVYYLNALRSLSDSLNYKEGLYLYYERMVVVSFTNGNFEKALKESLKGLELARQIKNVSFEIVMLNHIGICYGYLNKYEEQLNYTLEAKKKIEATRDSAKLSGIYHALANVYSDLGQHRKSVDCALHSIKMVETYKKKNDYSNRTYISLAYGYAQLNMPDSAIIFYEKAISESKRLNDKFGEGTTYKFAANLFSSLGRYDKMQQMAERSLALAKELKSRQFEATAYYTVALANYYNRNNTAAAENVKKSLVIAEADSMGAKLQDAYRLLSYIAARDGDFSLSVKAMNKSDSIQQAGLNEKVAKAAAELEKKYETEKKDTQIRLQQVTIKQKNTLNYILIGGALLLMLILVLVYLNYKHRQKIQQQRINELETEKQLTATEAVLKGEEQERTRLAKDLHDGLGGMLSGLKHSFGNMQGNLIMTPENAMVFNRTMDMLDSSIKEMRRVAHNMMPEALVKFGLGTALKDFCSDINLTGALRVDYQSIGMEDIKLDNTTSITIFRIVQELLNNTMKHAAAHTAIVQLSRTDGTVSVTVEDDGKGFDPGSLRHTEGIGWNNIRNRVDFLKGKIDIKSGPGQGTSVLIEFKI